MSILNPFHLSRYQWQLLVRLSEVEHGRRIGPEGYGWLAFFQHEWAIAKLEGLGLIEVSHSANRVEWLAITTRGRLMLWGRRYERSKALP